MVMPGASHLAFAAAAAIVGALRLVEVALSRRHERALLARGGKRVPAGSFPQMVALHAAFLVAAPLEAYVLVRPFIPALAATAGALFLAAQALRWWAIATLGERWTVVVVVLPGAPLVTGGPYRWLRHPNYLAVALEIASFPLLHGAWITALIFTAANAALLAQRIAGEERALVAAGGTLRRRRV